MRQIKVVDSHTGGEPTRVVVVGGPELGDGSLKERREVFRREFDRFRTAVVCEPRGSEVMVGALLVEPTDRECAAAVIFFNNVGYLGMCGHGTIGLVVTLAHLGKIDTGECRIETPVGVVSATLHEDGSVSVANVPSFRRAKGVVVEVKGVGAMVGDVAWGGNWFFLTKNHGANLGLGEARELTELAENVRDGVHAAGFPEVDHVELFGVAEAEGADSRNFVLCPGSAYDRSPCGTGTSAKLACLAADGKLAEGEEWVQESVIGSLFSASYRWLDRETGRVQPTIRGKAFVNGETMMRLDERDPFCWGIGRKSD